MLHALSCTLALLTAAGAAPARVAVSTPDRVVVLDPGHGGEQDGAISDDGVREKDVALAIARRVRERLAHHGVRVLLTRDADVSVPLGRRAALANAAHADLFVSIHLNAMPGAARAVAHGVETYFLSPDATDASATAVAARENADRVPGEPELGGDDPIAMILADLAETEALAQSSRLAYAVHDRLVAALRAADRGVKQAPMHVLAATRVPAVLLEVGFLSHGVESRRLATPEYQERIARAIAEAIDGWRAAATTRG